MNELLLHDIGKILHEETELPEDFVVTLTRVDAAPDLKTAKAYFSVVPASRGRAGEEFMAKNARLIQGGLGKGLKLKFTPKLTFVHDTQEDRAEKIEGLLDNIGRKE